MTRRVPYLVSGLGYILVLALIHMIGGDLGATFDHELAEYMEAGSARFRAGLDEFGVLEGLSKIRSIDKGDAILPRRLA
jgi:hypothetical protein